MKPEASPASIPTAKFPRSLNTLHEAMGEYVRVCVCLCVCVYEYVCVCVSACLSIHHSSSTSSSGKSLSLKKYINIKISYPLISD